MYIFIKEVGSITLFEIKCRIECLHALLKYKLIALDTTRKLNAHKTFRKRSGRLSNVLCTFNLSPVSSGGVGFI